MADTNGTCSDTGCIAAASCRGLCREHYLRQMRPCTVEGCDRRVNSYGMCQPHHRQRVRGLPITEPQRSPKRTTPLSERVWALTDRIEAGCWDWKGTLDSHGYGQITYRGAKRKAHRVVWELTNGPIPSGMVVDHMCRSRRCVNPAHLQVVTQKQNLENYGGVRPDSKSGVRGVRQLASGKWQVCVQDNGKKHYLSGFETVAEAGRAAVELRNQLHTNNLADRGVD